MPLRGTGCAPSVRPDGEHVSAERGSTMMISLAKEIELCLDAGLYHVALLTALTVPDICGAMDAEDGISKHEKTYAPWFKEYVAPQYLSSDQRAFTGKDCYQFRCRMLHQGTTAGKGRYAKIEVLFKMDPEAAGIAFLRVDGGTTLVINGPVFCRHVAYAIHNWLEVVEDTPRFKKNSEEVLRMLSLSFVPQ